MRRNWIAMLALAGAFELVGFGQQYPQQNPPYQGGPEYSGQNQNGPYDNGQYAGDTGDQPYDGDPGYGDESQAINAPAPPPMPNYAYQRPPMPGPGYYWVDGYWNFLGGRYSWVGGYWMLPPYSGAYWVAPRYSSGRFFVGFWGGGRQHFNRGFARNDFRYQRGFQAPRRSFPAPSQNRFQGSFNHRNNSGNARQSGHRH